MTDRELQRLNGTDWESRALADDLNNHKDDDPITTFMGLQHQERMQASITHGNFHSAHEAYAVIAEELDEFWQEVRKTRSVSNHRNMLRELVRIAAMAHKAAISLQLIES